MLERPGRREQALVFFKLLFILGPIGAYRQYKAARLASKPGVKVYVKDIRIGD